MSKRPFCDKLKALDVGDETPEKVADIFGYVKMVKQRDAQLKLCDKLRQELKKEWRKYYLMKEGTDGWENQYGLFEDEEDKTPKKKIKFDKDDVIDLSR